MNHRSRIGRLVSGFALFGTFLTWLVLRADLMGLIGQHNNLIVGLVLLLRTVVGRSTRSCDRNGSSRDR